MKSQIHTREGGRTERRTGWGKKARKKGGPSGGLQQDSIDHSKIRKMTKRYSYKFDLQFLWEKISIDQHSKGVIKMGV